MIDYHTTLLAACAAALAGAGEDDTCIGAARRVYHDGSTTWLVWVGDEHLDFTTHLVDDWTGRDPAALAAMIAGCWGEDWDDYRAERPVGDESHGSSDWSQRNGG